MDTPHITHNQQSPETPALSRADKIEETLIAVLLGLMTLLVFANVVARYVFNSNILWALQATVFIFAWMVLLGASYLVKKNAHIGVDIIIALLPPPLRRLVALFCALICTLFAFWLLKGAWDYWANFANLPKTEGRIFPTGFEDRFREKGWYTVDDIPMLPGFAWVADIFNEGEAYEKMPRFIPYAILPLSAALLFFRFIQITYEVWKGTCDRVIKDHELSDL